MSFQDLHLHSRVLKALQSAGYESPTEVQAKAIPKIMKGVDIRASAQTGTGKTAAFLLPALTQIANSKSKGKGPRALILVPTRELAQQIMEQAKKYSKYLKDIKTVCICGGMPYPPQMRQLAAPHDILIATPGRLIDFLEQKQIRFPRLELLILDEADRMLDMGFAKPVEQIVSKTPPTRQTLLFSATMLKSVIKMSDQFLNKPIELTVHAEKQRHENIEQSLYFVDNLSHKNRLLEHILDQDEIENMIIFTSTKRHADQLFYELRDQGHLVAALHGDMNQSKRTRTIKKFKEGRINIVVATDVAARGIDVPTISHVINFDLPRNIEDYVHRIGRTGRAGKNGTAFSFVGSRDKFLVKKIEEFTGVPIAVSVIKGMEPNTKSSNQAGRSRRRGKFSQNNSGNGSKRNRSSKAGPFKGPAKKSRFKKPSRAGKLKDSSKKSRSQGAQSAGNFRKKRRPSKTKI